MNETVRTHNLGFPRIGTKRELKRALESYWSAKTGATNLLETAGSIRQQNWLLQKAAGIDLIPSNDFSLYDQLLDACVLVGAVPERFGHASGEVSLSTYVAMARGVETAGPDCTQCHPPASAMEMTRAGLIWRSSVIIVS